MQSFDTNSQHQTMSKNVAQNVYRVIAQKPTPQIIQQQLQHQQHQRQQNNNQVYIFHQRLPQQTQQPIPNHLRLSAELPQQFQHQQHQFQHKQLLNQQLQRQQQKETINFTPHSKYYQFNPNTVKYTPTNEPSQIIQVNPVYNASNFFQHQNQQQQQLSQPSSMISPPMEKPSQFSNSCPPWQQIKQPAFELPSVGTNALPFCALSSYLNDDRETPAPMPVECTLGTTPDTPSPSLPSCSPPSDTSLDPSFFLMTQFEDTKPNKRRMSNNQENLFATKRHRRSKSEIAADNLEAMKKLLKISLRREGITCKVNLTPITLEQKDMPVRVFVGLKGIVVRKNLPRVPRMKIVLTEFNRIATIGFMRTQHGIAFSCLSQCKFKTYDPKKFQIHLKSHESQDQDSQSKTCSLCEANICKDSLLYELFHMLKIHLLKPRDVLDKLFAVNEIIYSKITPLTVEAESDESENESETTEVYTREIPETNIIDQETQEDSLVTHCPIGHIIQQRRISECSEDSQKTEDYDYKDDNQEKSTAAEFDHNTTEAQEKKLEADLNHSDNDDQEKYTAADSDVEDVEAFLHDLEAYAEDLPATPQTQEIQAMSDLKDPDYTPNEEHESEDDITQDTAETSEEDEVAIKETPNATDEESDDDQERLQIVTDVDSDDSQATLPVLNQTSCFLGNPLKTQINRSSRSEVDSDDPNYSPKEDNEDKNNKVIEKTMSPKKDSAVKKSPIVLCLKTLKEQKAKEKKKAHKKRRNRKSKRKHGKKRRSESETSNGMPKSKRRRIIFDSSNSSDSEPFTEVASKPDYHLVPSEPDNSSAPLEEAMPENDSQNEITQEQESSVFIENSSEINCGENANETPVNENDATKSVASPNPVNSSDFLNRIPFHLMEKIKRARGTQLNEQQSEKNVTKENLPETPKEASNLEPKTKIFILENIVLSSVKTAVDSPTKRAQSVEPPFTRNKSRLQKAKKPKQTARKSTSKSNSIITRKSQKKLFKAFNIKPCSVNIVSSEKRIRLIIEASRKAGVANVNTDMKFSVDDDGISPEMDDCCDMYNISQNSDIINEIDYDESEANEPLHLNPPKPVKDFPALLNVIESPSKDNSEKNEGDEDLFFDCENMELPQTPLTPEVENVSADLLVNESNTQGDEAMYVQVINEPQEKLVNLSKLYPWIDDEIAEKWKKAESCANAMIEDRYMFSTYKCMSIKCSYYTTDMEKFKAHVNTHLNIDTHFICSFCLLDETEPKYLFKHLKKCHKFDRYQCSQCMYRACEKVYCDIHRRKFHDPAVLIYKSPTQAEVFIKKRNSTFKSLDRKLDEIVKPIQCKCKLRNLIYFVFNQFNFFFALSVCMKKFYVPDEYNEHLQKELESTADDKKINLIYKEILEMQQVTTMCKFGVYQCVHCSDGFNDEGMNKLMLLVIIIILTIFFKDLIQEHLSEVHPSELAFYAKRAIHQKYPTNVENHSESIRYPLIVNLYENLKKEHQTSIKVRTWKVLNKSSGNEELTSTETVKFSPKKLTILNVFSLSAEQR